MYEIIDSKNCNDKFICLYKAHEEFIIGVDEIIYLNIGDEPVIVNDNSKKYSQTSKSNNNGVDLIFEYNKPYLDFNFSHLGYGGRQYYFFKGTNRALNVKKSLPLDDRYTYGKEKVNMLTREEIENIFNKDNYDSMYIIDVNGKILFANNKLNGLVIYKKIIPSDEEIIMLEQKERQINYEIYKRTIGITDNNQNNNKIYNLTSIDKIYNLKLYGGLLFRTYSNILITVKDGKFNLKWFRIDFMEKDKFKLTTTDIPNKEPTVDDIINYTKEEEERLRKLEEKKRKEEEAQKQTKKKVKRKWFKNI